MDDADGRRRQADGETDMIGSTKQVSVAEKIIGEKIAEIEAGGVVVGLVGIRRVLATEEDSARMVAWLRDLAVSEKADAGVVISSARHLVRHAYHGSKSPVVSIEPMQLGLDRGAKITFDDGGVCYVRHLMNRKYLEGVGEVAGHGLRLDVSEESASRAEAVSILVGSL